MRQEVSDHLAKIFFENKNEKKKVKGVLLFIVLTSGVLITFVFVATFLLFIPGRKHIASIGQNFVLKKHDGPYVLNFDFTDSSAKLQSLIINMPDIDLSAYNGVRFFVRLTHADGRKLGPLKVELSNQRRETSNLYISEIDNGWKKVDLSFSDFAKIRDWSHPTQLIFTVEEWNLYPKKGELLIDDITFFQ